ncbi:hypothetical protein DAEQUDRAFT_768116 [Daedalea quercina L-15889]|uniref:Uncharacterized protein n=1 Tax=Daedalea quercina L-15889 TaxID=1314783 RepID=A0A165MYX0_9APHY|nr:hypothetical protein DAEQUDRAFT_768116 [Daedalea quercina L-15889]
MLGRQSGQRFNGSNYVLPSDSPERQRLSLQHQLSKHAFDDRLIIRPIAISSEDHVLDSGTGSSTWLLDAISTLP